MRSGFLLLAAVLGTAAFSIVAGAGAAAEEPVVRLAVTGDLALAAGLAYTKVRGTRIAVLGFAPYAWAQSLLDIPAAQALLLEADEWADIVVVRSGSWEAGELVPLTIAGNGIPRPDLKATGPKLVRKLSHDDFGRGRCACREAERFGLRAGRERPVRLHRQQRPERDGGAALPPGGR